MTAPQPVGLVLCICAPGLYGSTSFELPCDGRLADALPFAMRVGDGTRSRRRRARPSSALGARRIEVDALVGAATFTATAALSGILPAASFRRVAVPTNRAVPAKRVAVIVRASIVAVAAMLGSGNAVSTESCTSGNQGREASARRDAGALTILVKADNWGEGEPRDIQVLLDNVASHFTRHLREGLSATIEIWNSAHGPMISWRLPGQMAYTILLDVSAVPKVHANGRSGSAGDLLASSSISL